MLRRWVVTAGAGGIALTVGCSLLTDLSGFSGGDASDAPDATPVTDSGSEAGPENDSGSGPDGSSCVCEGLVSAYRFENPLALGHDFVGKNDMGFVNGGPKQSTVTPPGLTGYSIDLDGKSSVCIEKGFTFDSTANHTLCWWSRPSVLAERANQFAQTCGYDTWTNNAGKNYWWRINNCNTGTAVDLVVPDVYSVGQWVQICQTYESDTATRTIVIDGKTNQKVSANDPAPIVERPTDPWCIGSYFDGGFFTGLIYLPMWFDRVLGDAELQEISSKACCFP